MMKKLGKIMIPTASLVALLSLIFLPFVKFDIQILLVRSGEQFFSIKSLLKLILKGSEFKNLPPLEFLEPLKMPLAAFFVLFVIALVLTVGVFAVSSLTSSPKIIAVFSSMGILSFIGSFISFGVIRSILTSGEILPNPNMVQIHSFSLQYGIYFAFALMCAVLIINIISLKKNGDK